MKNRIFKFTAPNTVTLRAQITKGDKGDKGDKGEKGDDGGLDYTNMTLDTSPVDADVVPVNGTRNGTLSQLKISLSNIKSYVLGTLFNNAGAHNSVYRGISLGTSVSAAQFAAIAAGTFEDMYIGDYWTIDSVVWRIAAFDYYYNVGDVNCTTHHVVVVPDSNLYTHVMNDTGITTGGYVSSKMYTEGLADAKTAINNAFGSAHILSHRQIFANAVTNGYPSGVSWYDSKVELMTEQNVYGGKVMSPMGNGATVVANYTVDKSQYPLFVHDPHMISNRQSFWLRDVVSAACFAFVNSYGLANFDNASSAYGVRPAFSIIG